MRLVKAEIYWILQSISLIQKMSFGKLLYKTNYNIRKIFRKLETTRKNIVKRQWSITFVKRCFDINVRPKFYNIYIYVIKIKKSSR